MLTISPSTRTDPEAFERILSDPAFAEVDAHAHIGAFGRVYYPAVYGNHDTSFAIYLKGTPALVCLCAPLDSKLGFYGMPLRLIVRHGLDNGMRQSAIKSAFLHIDELMEEYRLREAFILDNCERAASPIEEACRLRSATMNSHPVAYVDLIAGSVAWRAALRKSSRSLINWGRRHLSMCYVNKDAPDRALFDQYRTFHAEVAGRVTRSDASWAVMYDWIARGGGDLVLAFLEGRLVAGSMFIDGMEVSTYASGVYDRTKFDKPLAHYPVWLGIERAQARGMKTLDLGEVPQRGTVPDKEFQIGYFKRGFATHIEDNLVWRWSSVAA
jgi:Acetyltransferase (GNAT) domain